MLHPSLGWTSPEPPTNSGMLPTSANPCRRSASCVKGLIVVGAGLINHATNFGNRKGIQCATWREAGVAAEVSVEAVIIRRWQGRLVYACAVTLAAQSQIGSSDVGIKSA